MRGGQRKNPEDLRKAESMVQLSSLHPLPKPRPPEVCHSPEVWVPAQTLPPVGVFWGWKGLVPKGIKSFL